MNGAQSVCSKVVKAGLSIEVGHEFASSVFRQYRKLSGKEVGSTVIRNKAAALSSDCYRHSELVIPFLMVHLK